MYECGQSVICEPVRLMESVAQKMQDLCIPSLRANVSEEAGRFFFFFPSVFKFSHIVISVFRGTLK